MTKKQYQMKSLVQWISIVVLGVFALWGISRAFSGSAQNVAECSVEGACVFEASTVEVKGIKEVSEELDELVVGAAVANRLPHGYWDTAEGYYVDGTAVIDGGGDVVLASTGSFTFGSVSTTVWSGTFADATTTAFCVLNPFGVTSTLDMASIRLTGVPTTSVSFVVATSTANTGLATSTAGFGTSGAGQMLNINRILTTVVTNTVYHSGTLVDPRSNQTQATASRINVGGAEYVCGVVGEGNGGSTAGVTDATNLFAGQYSLRFLGY